MVYRLYNNSAVNPGWTLVELIKKEKMESTQIIKSVFKNREFSKIYVYNLKNRGVLNG